MIITKVIYDIGTFSIFNKMVITRRTYRADFLADHQESDTLYPSRVVRQPTGSACRTFVRSLPATWAKLNMICTEKGHGKKPTNA